MCGRFVLATSTDDLLAEFDIQHVVHPAPEPSWNVAPTDPVALVAERRVPNAPPGGPLRRELRAGRWGLVPHWAKERSTGLSMINARAETLESKPAFRAAAARRRCLVPSNGYYEWTASGRTKTPYFLHDAHDAVLAMAGLYEVWRDPALPDDHPERLLWTVAVVTRAAPDTLGHIHDRTPVVVPPDLRADWLNCADTDAGPAPDVRDLLAAIPPPHLVPREVGRAVGNVRNNGPSLIEPAAEEPGTDGPESLF